MLTSIRHEGDQTSICEVEDLRNGLAIWQQDTRNAQFEEKWLAEALRGGEPSSWHVHDDF